MEQLVKAVLEELYAVQTAATRRLEIGGKLAKSGDLRHGSGLKQGIPDIAWLPIVAGGDIAILRHWVPDTPDEEVKTIQVGTFMVKPFYIGKFLVTHAQFQALVTADDGYSNPTWWQGMPMAVQHQPIAEQRIKLDNHPRDSVSWYQAVAFTRWLDHQLCGLELPHPTGNGRWRVGENAQICLPTEWEWQWAAQNGIEARPYPWGKAKDGYANTAESGLEQTTAVGMYPHGAAACGAMDMAGNLMEWCANDKLNIHCVDVQSPATKVLRGGDWGYGLANAACTYCDDEEPDCQDPLNGFRVVLVEKR